MMSETMFVPRDIEFQPYRDVWNALKGVYEVIREIHVQLGDLSFDERQELFLSTAFRRDMEHAWSLLIDDLPSWSSLLTTAQQWDAFWAKVVQREPSSELVWAEVWESAFGFLEEHFDSVMRRFIEAVFRVYTQEASQVDHTTEVLSAFAERLEGIALQWIVPLLLPSFAPRPDSEHRYSEHPSASSRPETPTFSAPSKRPE